MYLSNGELDPEYLIEEELAEEEFIEAGEKLLDRAYRKATEWGMAVKREESLGETDSLAEEAAETAYVTDRMKAEYIKENGFGSLSDEAREVLTETNRAWTFVNEAGTNMQYIGKEPEEISEGAFTLIDGQRDEFETTDWNSHDELYTAPSEYLDDMSLGFQFTSFEVNKDADLDNLPADEQRIQL